MAAVHQELALQRTTAALFKDKLSAQEKAEQLKVTHLESRISALEQQVARDASRILAEETRRREAEDLLATARAEVCFGGSTPVKNSIVVAVIQLQGKEKTVAMLQSSLKVLSEDTPEAREASGLALDLQRAQKRIQDVRLALAGLPPK
jgi:hypothetical protein